jgi:ribosome-associated translation inhibitor RaiA
VEIVFHAHHAVISEHLRARAERAVQKAATRLRRAVDATVRFEEDGPTRRVEIVLHAPKQRPVVAAGEARLFGPALSAAAARLQVQVAKLDPTRARARRAAGDGALAGSADGALDGALDEPPAGIDLGDSGGEIGVADANTAEAPARA